MCFADREKLVDIIYRLCYAYINKNTENPCKTMETEGLELALEAIHKYSPQEFTDFIENEIDRHYEARGEI